MRIPLFSFLFCLMLLPGKAQLLQERIYKTQGATSVIEAGDYTRDGNVIYAGISFKTISRYETSYLLVKPNADTLWTRKGPEVTRYEADIKQAPGGGYIFAGGMRPANYNSANISDMVLERLNQNGTLAWTKPYPKANTYEVPRALAIMPDRGYIVGIVSDNDKFYLTRTDSMGSIKWQKDYTWSNSDDLADLKLTPNGNIIVAGNTDYPAGPYHIKVMLFNQNGDSLKGKQLIVAGFGREEFMYDDTNTIIPLSDGGFLLTGRVDTTITGTSFAGMGMLLKLDSDLNIVWKYVHRTNPVEEHIFTETKELADGSIIVLAYKAGSIGSNTFELFRFGGPALNVKTIYSFPSTICNKVRSNVLTELNDSTFLVAGDCQNPGNVFSMYVGKVKIKGLPHTITATKPELASQTNALGQSYPNPAQDQALISYNLSSSTKSAKILLTDITGRQVGSYSLKVNQKQGSLPVNLSGLRNGLYLYSLVIDGKPVATKKLAVAR